MKKIVFSSVLVFSILNAKTLITEDDFLQWSPTPSNINPKLAETVNLDYWKDKITESIVTDFKTAVEKVPTAQANIQKMYDHLDGLLKSRFISDNVINILAKNGLDDGLNEKLGGDIADVSASSMGAFVSFLIAETQKEKTTKKITEKEREYQAKLEKLGIDDSNKEQVYKLIRLKLLNDELVKVASNFDPKTIDIINGTKKGSNVSDDFNSITSQLTDKLITDDLNEDSVDKKILDLYSTVNDFQYLIDNYKEDKSILSILIKPDGVDKLIRKVEKENYSDIQEILNSKELKDIAELTMLVNNGNLPLIYGLIAGTYWYRVVIYHMYVNFSHPEETAIQDAEDAREALEQAIKATKEFNNLMGLNTFLQNNPLADGVDSSDIAELYDDTKTLEYDKDFKNQNPQTRQKVQAKADTFATKVIESKKSEVMTNVTAPTLVQLNNMTKRLGELRDLNARYGAWLRSYGGQMSADSKHINYYSIQLGADKVNRLKNDKLIIGFLAGFDKINGYIDSQTYSVGGYVSYLHSSGVFSDMVAKYTHTKHEKSGHEFDKQHSFLASFESGYRFGFGYEFYVEQSLEFITGYIGKYQDKVGTSSISIDAYTPFIVKPQAHIGGMVGGFSYRLGVGGVLNVAEQEAKISLNMDEISKGLKANGKTSLDKNNHGFVSLGGAYKVGKKSRISLSAERSFGGKIVNDYEINATIRVGF